jgi:hypothetical protein
MNMIPFFALLKVRGCLCVWVLGVWVSALSHELKIQSKRACARVWDNNLSCHHLITHRACLHRS